MARQRRNDDEAALLALAGFILALALLTVAASLQLLAGGQDELVRTGDGNILDDYGQARQRLIEFMEGQSPESDVNLLAIDLENYLVSGFAATNTKNLVINASLASDGTFDGLGEYADECSFTDDPAVCRADPSAFTGAYNAETYDGSTTFTHSFDQANNGVIRTNGDIVGAIVKLQVRGPTQSITEVLVIELQGQA